MTRTLAPWSLALGLLAVSSTAAAQPTTGFITTTLLKVGTKTYNSQAKKPISQQECDDKVDLTFRVDKLPGGASNPEFVEVWLGSDCNRATRLDEAGTKCAQVGSEPVTDLDVSIPKLIVPVEKICDKDGEIELFFLGVKSLLSPDVATVFTKTTVKIDTTPPVAPTKVSGGSGETEIEVKWRSAETDIDHYVLIWDDAASSEPTAPGDAGSSDEDAGAAGPSDCSSLLLMAGDELGADPSKLPEALSGKTLSGKGKSTTFNGTSLGSELAAVGVIAVDVAGNASPVSNIACLKVVPTVGFWDQYRLDGGTTETGCACSVPGQSTSFGAAWPVGLACVALYLRSRRRRA